MEVIGNNLYEPRDNPSLAFEMGGITARRKIARMELDLIRPLERSAPALAMMDSLEVVEECCVDVMLELSLGLSSDEVECKKWVGETNETVIVKKPKIEEGPMPYCLKVISMVFIGPKDYCYAYMTS
ncbi:hypothetical protein IEQ34_000019 [Dendrobium chrysotoxum]|uniref:Uncharacterized protein n=1 Tax=Dendrobium chrysotoxum TaxID=161865 RepID=A0AAV7HMC6_DENCH|nr:hypothetical protein IEQ34_000019 [Dendrobium chrysotoxum]